MKLAKFAETITSKAIPIFSSSAAIGTLQSARHLDLQYVQCTYVVSALGDAAKVGSFVVLQNNNLQSESEACTNSVSFHPELVINLYTGH